MSSARQRRLLTASLALLLLTAAAVRIHHLGFESLWMDEIHQVSVCSHPLTQVAERAQKQVQPPLDYWICNLVQRLADTDTALRLPAALFGVGAVLLLFVLGARMVPWPFAAAAALLLTFSPYHVYYSQEARPYSIAIFFTLLTLLALERLLNARAVWPGLALLPAAVMGLLLSRTLAPLVVVAVLALALLGALVLAYARRERETSPAQRRRALALLVFVAALVIHLPRLRVVMAAGEAWVPEPTRLGLATLVQGFERFDLGALWRAYQVQTEPLGALLLLPLLLSPALLLKTGLWQRRPALRLVCYLVFAAAPLQVFVFLAKSKAALRPPYLVYLLPCALIVVAAAAADAWSWAGGARRGRLMRSGIIAVAVVALGLELWSFIDFKQRRIKTDWRGACARLSELDGPQTLLVFDAVAPCCGWEPTFYGFARYYRGDAARLAITGVPRWATRLRAERRRPVLVLFNYRDYLLTSTSRHALVPVIGEDVSSALEELARDPALEVRSFTGLTLVSLPRRSGSAAQDLYEIFGRVLAHLRPDHRAFDLLLARASLGKAIGDPGWRAQLDLAVRVIPPGQEPTVQGRVDRVRGAVRVE